MGIPPNEDAKIQNFLTIHVREIFKIDKYKLKIKYNKIWGNQMRVFLSKGATKIQTF